MSRATATVLLVLGAALAAAPSTLGSAFPAAGTLVVRSVAARHAPDPAAPVVRVLPQFRPDFRLQVVLALGQRRGADGRIWYRLSLPMRPNGTTGWIPATAADVEPVHVRIVVHRGLRRLDVFRDGHRIDTTPVAVGMPAAPTPLGRFYAAAAYNSSDPFFGPYAIETSAYSSLSDWPGGGVVGIHGTSLPGLIGQAVSHGCIRMSNAAVLRLKREVPLGSLIDIVRR
jgi:lipoprotein-anchoring transpeptidase ErfK/SrfK